MIQSPDLSKYQNHPAIIIQRQNDFRGWSGNGTINDPYIIEGLKIHEAGACVSISYTSVHFVIRNCYFESTISAVRTVMFSSVTNGRLENCTIINSLYGMSFGHSTYCAMVNCTVIDSDLGIYVINSSNITLVGNSVYRNTQGISITNSTDCEVISNTVYMNTITGIRLDYDAYNCTIYNNLIGWNRASRLSPATINAIDNGNLNLWDDNVSQGNYWSDFEVGEPYEILGSANTSDRFPSILLDNEEPVLDKPEDLIFDEGVTGNSIIWNCTDQYPCVYEIYLDGERILEQTWNESIIIFNVDHLTAGSYNYTLYISDPIHTIADSVIVRVYIDILADISPEILLTATLLSVVLVVFILVVVNEIR